MNKEIVEKQIGISPDYQYKAMRKSLWAKRNWHRNKFEVVKMLHKFRKTDEVLDLGTGSGNFELLFARFTKNIEGIDYNDDALLFLKKELKKRKIKNVKLTCADMRKLPTELYKKKFDLILSVDTIEHISKKDGKQVAIWSKKRLKNNGKLIIITPNYDSLWTWLEPVLDVFSFTPNMGKHQHLSNYSVKSMSAMLSGNGYRINTSITFNLFSFIFPGDLCRHLLKLETKILKDKGCLMAIEATPDRL